MKSIDRQKAIEMIAQNAWTLLVIDASGLIREAVGFNFIPSLEWEERNKANLSGCGISYIPQKRLTLEELEKKVDETVKGIKFFRAFKNNS